MHVEVLVATGRDDEARAQLDRLVATNFADIAPAEQPHSFATHASVACALDHTAAAHILRARLIPWSGLIPYDGDGGVLPAVDLYLGRLSTLLGNPTAAARHLASARRLHQRLGSPLLLAASHTAESAGPASASRADRRGG